MRDAFYLFILHLDLALAAACAGFMVFMYLYIVAGRMAVSMREKRLRAIKSDILAILLDPGARGAACPAVTSYSSASELIDVVTNREGVIFDDGEKAVMRRCFASEKNIAQLMNSVLFSRNKWKKIEAMVALGYVDSSGQSLGALARNMYSRDKDIAYYSMEAVGQIKTPESAALLLDFLHNKTFSGYKIMSILETFPSETAPAIMQAAWRSDANVRFWTLKLLSKFKPAGCVSQVGLLTGDVSADVRAAACECLGNLGDERGIPALKGCLSDKAWFVRMHAVRALESSIGAECLPFVSGLIKDSSWNAREEVKAAMSRHIEAALPYLAEFLKDKDQITRNDMVEVAERSGFLAAFLQGRAAVNKEKADIARSVIDVICQIRGKNA